MNILFFLDRELNPENGGIIRVSDILMRAMSESHNIYCLTIQDYGKSENEGFFYIPLPKDKFNEANMTFVHDLCRNLQIDIIINEEALTPLSSEFIVEARPEGVVLVSVIHSTLAVIYGLISRLPVSLKELIPRKYLCEINKLTFPLFRIRYRKQWNRLIERSNKIVVLDKTLTNDLQDFLNKDIPADKVVAINNPITLPPSQHIPIKNKKKQLLFVGRLSREKNVRNILKAWRMIQEKHPDWTLKIVGDGVQRNMLEGYVKTQRIERVVFTGQKNPEEDYKESAIFCMMSLFEGFPLVLVEAMNNSLVPVVCDTFPSAKSLIDKRDNGILLPSLNTASFAKALDELMNNEELLDCMSIASHKKSQKFAVRKILNEWQALFDNECGVG